MDADEKGIPAALLAMIQEKDRMLEERRRELEAATRRVGYLEAQTERVKQLEAQEAEARAQTERLSGEIEQARLQAERLQSETRELKHRLIMRTWTALLFGVGVAAVAALLWMRFWWPGGW